MMMRLHSTGNVKRKARRIMDQESPEGVADVYATLALTSAPYIGMGDQRHAPGVLPPAEETQYSLYRRLGGPQGWSGRVRKISPPTRIRRPDPPAIRRSLYRLSYPRPQRLQDWRITRIDLHLMGTRAFSRRKNGRGVNLTHHLHPLPRLKTREAIPLLSLYAFKL